MLDKIKLYVPLKCKLTTYAFLINNLTK